MSHSNSFSFLALYLAKKTIEKQMIGNGTSKQDLIHVMRIGEHASTFGMNIVILESSENLPRKWDFLAITKD